MNSARSGSGSPPGSRPGTAGSAPWVPPGVRPHTTPSMHATPITGTRRNRAVERVHVFLENKEVSARDPSNYFWLYAAYEYRLQTPHEEAKATCFKTIDRLIEKIRLMYAEAPPPVSEVSGVTPTMASNAKRAAGKNEPQLSSISNSTAAVIGDSVGLSSSPHAGEPRAHLIFDLISTKKHIGAVPNDGLPFRLGHDIYRYVDQTYNAIVATTFVGLTDNTARRVGRDVYYNKSDDLSKTRFGFHTVDREHLFIVFPPVEINGHEDDGADADGDGPNKKQRNGGGGVGGTPQKKRTTIGGANQTTSHFEEME